MSSWKELYNYRDMLKNLVKRDIRGRYKGSALGFIWNFVLPLVQILVMVIVFGAIFKNQVPNYPLYMISGMVIWIWFSESISETSGVLVGNSELLKKIYFPRAILPISTVISKMINFLILLLFAIIVMVVMKHEVTINLLFLPIIIVISYVMILGLSLILSALDVFLRDVQYIISALLMAWIWATPIMYMTSTINNELLNTVCKYNPMTYFVEMFHDVLYLGIAPNLENLLIALAIAVVALVVGVIVFRQLEGKFAEVL